MLETNVLSLKTIFSAAKERVDNVERDLEGFNEKVSEVLEAGRQPLLSIVLGLEP